MKKHIPNVVTLLNLFCGGISIILTLYIGDYVAAVCFIALAAFFDLLDGMLARMLHATSPIGADLDSLSDVVSFGLAPALLLFVQMDILFMSLLGETTGSDKSWIYALPVLLIALFAALRLAKFNNDIRQAHYFFGLPVPANALFWCGYVFLMNAVFPSWELSPVLQLGGTSLLVVFFSWLMICDIRMLSFKALWAKDLPSCYRKHTLIGLSIVLISGIVSFPSLSFGALSLALLVYIIGSILVHFLDHQLLKEFEQRGISV